MPKDILAFVEIGELLSLLQVEFRPAGFTMSVWLLTDKH